MTGQEFAGVMTMFLLVVVPTVAILMWVARHPYDATKDQD